MSKYKIVISGAGIGGLLTAIALQKKGFTVSVLEQATELKEVGAGLQLSPNVLRALYQLGLEKDLLQVVSEPLGKEIRLWSTGQTWSLFDMDEDYQKRYGYPYFMIYRPDLHNLLLRAVEQHQPGTVQLGCKVVAAHQTPTGVEVVTSQQRVMADIFIAADGVHSTIRNQFFGADRPQFSGCMAWRGVIPMAKLPEHLRHNVGVNWIGPGAHVINYPLRRGELMNFVGILERDDWLVESWNTQGTHAECHTDFQGWHDDIHTMIEHIEIPFKWALMSRPPLEQWVKGSIVLLGDAAHPTLPFLAQGAGMAIEDGFVLAEALSKESRLSQALSLYEQARVERCKNIVNGSTANGRRFHNAELKDQASAEAYVTREWTKEKIASRYDWIFNYKVDEAV